MIEFNYIVLHSSDEVIRLVASKEPIRRRSIGEKDPGILTGFKLGILIRTVRFVNSHVTRQSLFLN